MVRVFHKSIEQARKELEKGPSHFTQGFLSGLGWAFGATVGFAVAAGVITFILAQLGTLPLIGQFFSDLQESLKEIAEIRKKLPR